ncbi:MAG: FIST N-terminal domain-containing protein [Planctomycetota bacterium]|nr:FIST N-terminal domain-containing protein [Planctomycetota bacterium]
MVSRIGSSTSPLFACSLAAGEDAGVLAARSAEECVHALAGTCDLALVFISRDLVPQAEAITAGVRSRLRPGVLLGVTAAGVIGGGTELEESSGVSILAARLPGATLTPFRTDDLIGDDEPDAARERIVTTLGAADDLRGVLLFADPFSVPLVRLLPAMTEALKGCGNPPILGGLASAANDPGGNAMAIDARVESRGGVGVAIRGPVRIDAMVSQGCRPFGPTFVVTKARRNIIFELGGKPALQVVSDVIGELSEDERAGLKAGLFVGRVVNEFKQHFGRGDFLIRNVLGVDQNHGAVALADQVHVGQTVRLHMRDARTAHEDLALLLDAQKLHAPPAGVLLVTCTGRGRRLFETPNHDAGAIVRAFLPHPGGESRARVGFDISAPEHAGPPLAGFFAAGEIGPIDQGAFLHGHTACAALFRGV